MKKPKLHEIRYKIAVLIFFLIIVLSLFYVLIKSDKSQKESELLQNATYTLNSGEIKNLNSQTRIKLKSISPMPSNCNDCFEEAVVTVIADGEEKDLNYRFGGFAGIMTGWLKADGVEIRIVEINKASVRFEYRKTTGQISN